jgi:hypothetical protein
VDGDAFRELTEPYRRELQVHCYRMLGSFQDAEDALQDTLLAAWQGLRGFEERASLRARSRARRDTRVETPIRAEALRQRQEWLRLSGFAAGNAVPAGRGEREGFACRALDFRAPRGEDGDRTRGPPDARGVAKRHHTDRSLNPSTVPQALGAVMTESNNPPSVVLVHGGFVDGSDWQSVYRLLRNDGYAVGVVQNPTLSLDGDVAAARLIIDEQDGPVVRVGHSYGGAVITEAGNDPNVAALVYVSAFAPDAGESVNSLIENPPPDAPVPPIQARGALS